MHDAFVYQLMNVWNWPTKIEWLGDSCWIHANKRTLAHTRTHMHMHTHAHARARTRIHTRTLTHVHAHPHTQTHARAHAHMRTHTHMRIDTQTHIIIQTPPSHTHSARKHEYTYRTHRDKCPLTLGASFPHESWHTFTAVSGRSGHINHARGPVGAVVSLTRVVKRWHIIVRMLNTLIVHFVIQAWHFICSHYIPWKRVSRRDPSRIWPVGAVAAIFKMANMNCQCPIYRRIT